MKFMSTILVLGIVGGGGWMLYGYAATPPEVRACKKIVDLCGDGDKMEVERCEKAMKKIKKVTGKVAVERATKCVGQSDSCLKAAGCVFGAGVSAIDEFVKGFEQALK